MESHLPSWYKNVAVKKRNVYCMTYNVSKQIFYHLFQNKDDKLSFEEFIEGSKKDPTIIQALTLYDTSNSSS